MAIRKTLVWFLLLLLIASAAGGGYVYWLFTRSDEFLHQALLENLSLCFPESQCKIGQARFDLQGRIRIYNLSVRDEPAGTPVVNLPETILVLDRDKLAQQQYDIRRVRLLRPEFVLIRRRDGHWNLEGLHLPKVMASTFPEWEVEHGIVSLRIVNEDSTLSSTLMLRNVNLRLVPTGKRRYQISCRLKMDQAEVIEVDGDWNVDAKTWSSYGMIKDLKVGADLLRVMAGFFPQYVEDFNRKASWLLDATACNAAESEGQRATDAHAGSPRRIISRQVSTASSTRSDLTQAKLTPEAIKQTLDAIHLNASMDVKFRCSQWKPDAALEFQVKFTIKQGQFENGALPFELRDVKGKVFLDNRQLIIRDLSARNGFTRLKVNGKIVSRRHASPGEFQIAISDLALDQRLRSRLPKSWHVFYNDLRPSGKVDVHVRLNYDGLGTWRHECDLTAKGCSFSHRKFPYRVEQVVGTMKQRENLLNIDLQGRAGQQRVMITGQVWNPGPLAEARITVQVDGLPLDDKLIAASNPTVRKTIEALDLQGTADVELRLHRPAGPNQKFQPQLDGRLHNCAINCVTFPYPLTKLNGPIKWNGQDWTSGKLSARHGPGQLTGQATYIKQAGSGILDLDVVAKGEEFDHDLLHALPPQMRVVYREFSPTGRFDVAAHVHWVPGSPPDVTINDLQFHGISISMRSFPYSFDGLTGSIKVADQKITIHKLIAQHDETKVKLKGTGIFNQRGDWHVSFDELFIDDLDTRRSFRRALPDGLREVFEATDPRKGRISVSGRLALRGTVQPRNPVVTAAWDVRIIHSGTTITVGRDIDLEEIHGQLDLQGTWDGQTVKGTGSIDLDSVLLKEHQFTRIRGPLAINGTQLSIGSQEVVSILGPGSPQALPPDSERITARFIDGTVRLDCAVKLDPHAAYRIKISLNNGKLERYAQLYAPAWKELRGLMNGWIALDGRGEDPDSLRGNGQLVIKPAALYELPVTVAIFKVLNGIPPDKTAFRECSIVFDVNSKQFDLRRIDLVGDAITLRGAGSVRFDKKLHLDFVSTESRRQLPVPVLGPVLGQTTKGLIRIQVRGTTKNPTAHATFPTMEETLKRFGGLFKPQQPRSQPNPFSTNNRPPRLR